MKWGNRICQHQSGLLFTDLSVRRSVRFCSNSPAYPDNPQEPIIGVCANTNLKTVKWANFTLELKQTKKNAQLSLWFNIVSSLVGTHLSHVLVYTARSLESKTFSTNSVKNTFLLDECDAAKHLGTLSICDTQLGPK